MNIDEILQRGRYRTLPPEDGVTYCAFCANLNAAGYVRFMKLQDTEWNNGPQAREFAEAIVPGIESVYLMDRILRFIQQDDPLAFLVKDGQSRNSVRASMYVAGFGVCAADSIWLVEQWRTAPIRRF